MSKNKKKRISVYVDVDLLEKCDELVRQHKSPSRSWIFVSALRDYLS